MGQTMNFEDQKKAQDLLHSIRFFSQKGWSPATSTNHSIRLNQPDRFLISRSGVDKSLFQDTDFVVINGAGDLIDPPLGVKPSAETMLHTMVYSKIPAVGCVLHTHSLLGTYLSQKKAKDRKLRLEGWEILKGLSGNLTHEMYMDLPIVSNSQDMEAIIQEMDTHWTSGPKGFLIAGHGLYSWGQTVLEAKRHIETLEFLFELYHLGEK